MSILRFLVITDTHLSVPGTRDPYDQRPFDRFSAVAKRIMLAVADIDLVIHCGDIGADASESELARAISLIRSTLPLPILFVRGNYDNPRFPEHPRDTLSSAPLPGLLPDDWSRVVRLKGYRLILLDADIAPSGFSARLGTLRLQLLERELAGSTEPTAIFLHYPPVELDCPSALPILLEDRTEFLTLMRSASVQAVFFGHAHQSVQVLRENCLFVGVPSVSTAFRCDPGQESFEPDITQASGYALVTWSPQALTVKQITAAM